MFFAGHMVLSYFVNRIIPWKVSYSLPLVFAASILPDTDFLFYSLFPHHTITHSITFWSIAYLPFVIIKRWKVLPYLAATFSHFLIGDIITGNPPILYGISDQTFGILRPYLVSILGSQYGTLYQSIIEAIMVILFLIIALRNKDIYPIFSGRYDIKHILILGIVIFIVFLGAYKNDVVYVAKQGQDILYIAYGIAAISNLTLLTVFLKGYVKKDYDTAKSAT